MKMENEPVGIPHNEEHLEALEETIQKLENILKQKIEISNRHGNILKEVEELNVIISGLYQKVDALREEDKKLSAKQPQSEEEWSGWFSRTEKITALYSKISDLEQEFEGLLTKAEEIQKDFEALE